MVASAGYVAAAVTTGLCHPSRWHLQRRSEAVELIKYTPRHPFIGSIY